MIGKPHAGTSGKPAEPNNGKTCHNCKRKFDLAIIDPVTRKAKCPFCGREL